MFELRGAKYFQTSQVELKLDRSDVSQVHRYVGAQRCEKDEVACAHKEKKKDDGKLIYGRRRNESETS